MRIRTRLSHCETTFSCTFCGRCVDTSSTRPNLRPSPAMRTACSVAIAVSGSSVVLRADVVRLVDHDQDRLTRGAAPPERGQHRLGRHGLLGPARERAEVRDDAAGPARAARDPRVTRDRIRTRSATGRCRGSGRARRGPAGRDRARRETALITFRGLISAALSDASTVSTRAAYSSRSAIGSRRSTAACSVASKSRKRTCRRSLAVVSRAAAPRLRPRRRTRSRTVSGASSRSSPSLTKSEFGSRITTRSDVSTSSRSRIVPSAYVLPDPDWPHRNV